MCVCVCLFVTITTHLPGSVFISARAVTSVLPAEPDVPLYAHLLHGPAGVPATPGLGREGLPGDHRSAIPGRVPVGCF